MDEGRWKCDAEVAVALSVAFTVATDALAGLPVCVSRLNGADLDEVLMTVDRLAAAAAAARFTLASEAQSRGEVASSSAGSLRQWVAERCPSLDAREAGTLARAVRELCVVPMGSVRAAVEEGRLSVAAGVVVASELAQLHPLLEPGAADAVLAGLVDIGESHGCAGVRGLRPALLARYGLGAVIQDEQDRRAGLTQLSCGHGIGGGITEYRMRLTPESRAVVEAAIDTLSRPVSDETGDSRAVDPWHADARSVEQRRGDALVEVCRRFASLTLTPASVNGDGLTPGDLLGRAGGAASPAVRHAGPEPGVRPGAGVKAAVLLTITMNDLRLLRRPGTVLGRLDSGALLGPETVRRLTCDGEVLPVVLDDDGHPLHLGRTRRLFTPAQTRALWLRDRHCTFPGCTVPATWCDAHHLRHWVDGGATDLDNGALLCGRHHTVVHRDRLTGRWEPHDTNHPDMPRTDPSSIDPSRGLETTSRGAVVWDRRPGSYDRAPPDA